MKLFAWSGIETELGIFRAGYSASGLAALLFPSDKSPVSGAELSAAQTVWHTLTAEGIGGILKGRRPALLPPFDLAGFTTFQQAVWREMLRLQPGQTLTYQELANAIRNPKATRAAGQACGRNPIPLLIPCHRILASGGKLGGFGGGLEMKRELLRREGVLIC